MRVAITGASGLVGSELAASLAADGHEVVRLVRREARSAGEARWAPKDGHVDTDRLVGADAVVNLAGAPLGPRRWTAAYEREIWDSRVTGTRTLAGALAAMSPPVPRLLSGSAVGFYGDTGPTTVDERFEPSHDTAEETAVEVGHAAETGSRAEAVRRTSERGQFLPRLAAAWEAATDPAEAAGVAVTHLRTGLVLDAERGLLGTVLPLFRLGLGGRIGDGRHYMSWISITDMVAALRFLLDRPDLTGPVNLCAPTPVTNDEYTRAVGAALRRPTPFPVPAFAMRAALGRFADETALAGHRVYPHRLLEAGFEFRHRELEPALAEILAR